jgi:NADH-quinone oxidoreductase subunit E
MRFAGSIMRILTEKYADIIEGILARYPVRKSAVLPLMHLAQEEYGYMSQEAVEEVADILRLDPLHVQSLAGFYSLFYEEPVGRYVLEICTDLACALRGADDFAEMACRKLGADTDEVSSDGLFTLKRVMCLGACDRAPVLQCNLRFEEFLDEAKFEALINRLRDEAASAAEEPSVVRRIFGYARTARSPLPDAALHHGEN